MATPVPGPRDYITPEAFRVADHLLGVPLAKPPRRLGAMLVDLLFVAILTQLLDAFAFLIALMGALLVFRMSRGGEGRWYRRFYRHGLGCFGAVLVFVALIVAVTGIQDRFDGDESEAPAGVTTDAEGNVTAEDIGLLELGALSLQGAALNRADQPAERDSLADELVESAIETGFTPPQIRTSAAELAEDEVISPASHAAIEAATERRLARAENRAPRTPAEIERDDSIAAALATRARADSTAAAIEAAGGDTALVALRDSLRAARLELEETRRDLALSDSGRAVAEERFEAGAVRWYLASISDELGLGLGWLGLYFTAFLVLGGGQTPGKKLFRLRVIRLDGRAIGWWMSLQRFGGYYASVFTGLLGFAEMLWDDNRQALQDKLAHTVVIQEPRKGARGQPVEVPFVGDEPVGDAALDDEPTDDERGGEPVDEPGGGPAHEPGQRGADESVAPPERIRTAAVDEPADENSPPDAGAEPDDPSSPPTGRPDLG